MEGFMNPHAKLVNNRKTGQGATEYVIILVLVAIASIAVITVFGDQLRELFNVGTKRLGGDTSTQVQQFDGSGDVNKGLNNF